MSVRLIHVTGALMALIVAGCSSDDTTTGITSWAGSTPHFKSTGNLNSESLNFDVEGADAADTSKSNCIRKYSTKLNAAGQPDLATADMDNVKLHSVVNVNGKPRRFELELKRNALGTITAGGSLKIVPRDDTKPPGEGQMWFEWEWHDVDTDATLLEEATQQGTFTLGEFTGTKDANGIIPDNTGTIGGFIDAKWSDTETIKISFTLKCGKNKIEAK